MPPQPADKQSKLFIEHRYEQSILSLLAKKAEAWAVADENYFFPEWGHGTDFPIWAMRNRTGANAYKRDIRDLMHLIFSRVESSVRKYLR